MHRRYSYKPYSVLDIDVDDVIYPCKEEWLREYNILYNDTLSPSQITSWDLHLYVRPNCGVKIYDILSQNVKIVTRAVPVEGSREVLQRLSEYYPIHITTSTWEEHRIERMKWIKEYFPFVSAVNFSEEKHKVASSLMLDDKPTTVEECSRSGLTAVCMDHPYNRQLREPHYRVKTMLQFEDLIMNFGKVKYDYFHRGGSK